MHDPSTPWVPRWWTNAAPMVVAHRGDALRAPENTFPAFDRALTVGADVIELDVQLCSDGTPVVIHDDRVDRTTSGGGRVRSHSRAELTKLDAGSWFDPSFADATIPTLEEVLAWAAARSVRLLVELKTHPILDRDVVGGLANVLDTLDHADAIVYSSDHVLLEELSGALPQVPLGVIVNENTPFIAEILDRTGAVLLSQSIWSLTPQTIELAQGRGCLVSAEARCIDDIDTLCSWGVDLIVNGRIDLAEIIHELRDRERTMR